MNSLLETPTRSSIVVYLINLEEKFFENFSSFPFYERPSFGNPSHFIDFFVSPHADHLGKSYAFLTKFWVEIMDA